MDRIAAAVALEEAAGEIRALRQRLSVAEAVVSTVRVFEMALSERNTVGRGMGEDIAWRAERTAERLRVEHNELVGKAPVPETASPR